MTEAKEIAWIERRVPIKDIKVKEQHRRHFDEKKLKELSENIKKVNVLQPLLLRTMGTEKPYELIAGERRLRAAKMAGLEDVPTRIGSFTDQEAAELQALENLQREDLTPIEEARAFKMLQDGANYDVKALAERVDKSVAYVYRAMALLELPAKIVDAIDAGQLTPAHGRVLLRATTAAREKLGAGLLTHIKRHGYAPTARQFWEDMERSIGRDLAKAAFPKDVAYAGQRSCIGCPFNSAEQTDLFDGVEKGRCTNPGCFDTKVAQGTADLKTKAKEDFKALTFAGVVGEEDELTGYRGKFKGGQILEPGLLQTQKMKEAMAKNPAGFAWAFIDPKNNWNGKPRAVVIAKTKDREVLPAGSKMTPSEKKARQQAIKQNFIARQVSAGLGAAGLATVSKFTKEHLAAIVSRMPYMNKDTREGLERCMTMPKERGELKTLAKLDEKTLRALAFGQAMWGYGAPDDDVLELVGVNVKKITAAATAAAAKAYDLKKAGKKVVAKAAGDKE